MPGPVAGCLGDPPHVFCSTKIVVADRRSLETSILLIESSLQLSAPLHDQVVL